MHIKVHWLKISPKQELNAVEVLFKRRRGKLATWLRCSHCCLSAIFQVMFPCTGVTPEEQFIGWSGKDGTYNSTELLEQVLVVKKSQPFMNCSWVDSDNVDLNSNFVPNTSFPTLIHPYGRCLQVVVPDQAFENRHSYAFFDMDPKDFFQGPFALHFFLVDPVNSPMIYPAPFQMTGDQIRINDINQGGADVGFWWFTSRISKIQHEQGDPQYGCKHYSKIDTYGKCLKKELARLFDESLNCTPPLLGEDMKSINNKRFNLDNIEAEKVKKTFFHKVNFFQSFACKTPCTQRKYEVH